jgi:serine/threonine-protein kinase
MGYKGNMRNLPMHTFKHLLISALMLLLVSCDEVQDRSQDIADEKDSLSIDNSEFYIRYPSTWTLDRSGEMGSNFILFASPDNDTDDFRENINLMIQNLAGANVDMDKFVEVSENQIKSKAMPNSQLITSERKSLADGEYHKLIYTGDQGIHHLQFEAYCWIKNEKAYVLTFTAEQVEFKNYQSIAESILDSFKLK